MYTHYVCPYCQIGGVLGSVCCGMVIHSGLQGFIIEQEVIVPGYGYGYVDPLAVAEAVVVEEIVEEVFFDGGYDSYDDGCY